MYRRSVSHPNSHLSFTFLPLQWQKFTSFQIFSTVCATPNEKKLWACHAHWHCWFLPFLLEGSVVVSHTSSTPSYQRHGSSNPFWPVCKCLPSTIILNYHVNCNKWDFGTVWNDVEHSITKSLHEPVAASQGFILPCRTSQFDTHSWLHSQRHLA